MAITKKRTRRVRNGRKRTRNQRGGVVDLVIQGLASAFSSGIGGPGGSSKPRTLTQEEKIEQKNAQIHEEIKKKIVELTEQKNRAKHSLYKTAKELTKRQTMNPFIKKIKSSFLLTNQNLESKKQYHNELITYYAKQINRLSNIDNLITNIKNKNPGETIGLSPYIMYKRIASLIQHSDRRKVIIAEPAKIQTEFGEFRINTGERHAYLTDNVGLSGIHPHSAQIVEHHTLLENLRNPKSKIPLIHPEKGHHFYVPHQKEPHIKPGNLRVMGPDDKISLYHLYHKNPHQTQSGKSGPIKMRPRRESTA